jgi:hypothetical protein
VAAQNLGTQSAVKSPSSGERCDDHSPGRACLRSKQLAAGGRDENHGRVPRRSLRFLERQRTIPRSSRRRSPQAPAGRPAEPRKATVGKPCSPPVIPAGPRPGSSRRLGGTAGISRGPSARTRGPRANGVPQRPARRNRHHLPRRVRLVGPRHRDPRRQPGTARLFPDGARGRRGLGRVGTASSRRHLTRRSLLGVLLRRRGGS